MKRRFFLCLLLLLTATMLRAQTNFAPPIQFDRLPSELGLSQNLISAIIQDRKGFLWFGTKDGLNRFDGYKFTVYRHDPFDSTSLSDSYITALLEDRAGRIWVGTFSGGLNLFDRATETFSHSMPDSANPHNLSRSRITAIAEDQSREGGTTIWIGTWGRGVNRLVLPAGAKTLAGAIYTRFMHDPNDPNSLGNNIISVFTVAKDTVWVVTNFAGHYQIIPSADRRNFEVRPVRWGSDLPIPEWQKRLETKVQTYAFGQGKNGKVWIGRENGFICWDAIAGEYTFHGLAAKNLMGLYGSFLEDRTGILWAGHSQGLRRYDLTAGTVADLRHDPNNPHSIAESGINSIYEDSGGILWFGSNGNGLFKYDPKVAPFSRPHRGAAKLSLWRGTSIRALCETRDPAPPVVWLSAAAGPLLHLNRTTGEIAAAKFVSPDEFRLEVVFSMLQDKKGVLWIGNTIGLHRLEWREGNLKAISYYEPEPDGKIENLRDGVYKIFEDRQGEIWIATITHLARLDQHNRRFVKYRFSATEPSTVQEYAYPFIHQDRRGVFWLGTLDGLQRFDPATRKGLEAASFKRYQNDPRDPSSLSFNVVRAIHEDPFQPDKYLWLGTAGGGLNRFDLETETFKHFTEKDGLPDKVIYAILSDHSGNLWMSTNKGLSKLDPRTHQFKNYDVKDGLQDNEFNCCAYFKSPSGELFFGGIGGFNAFYPEDIQDNPHAPPVALTGFQIFNKPVSLNAPDSPLQSPISETKELTLRYDQKVFSFEFAALDYTDPSKNQYAYKMENFDNDWRAAGTNRTATYTNLDPGEYIFRVKGANNDGVWNEEGAALKITITPPWWRTWWAYAFYMIAGVAALVGFIKRREYALRKRTRALEAAVVERTAQVQTQNERLEAQAHKLQELDHLKSNFFANISHEFRTPLTLILGPAEQEIEQAEEGRLKRNLALIKNNAQRLLRLINQLLDLARLESKKMVLKASRGDLVEFLKGLTMSFASLAEHKRIALQFFAPVEKLEAYFDQDKLEKIFYNLLSNAFKFTPEGGEVEVAIGEERKAKGDERGAKGEGRRAVGEERPSPFALHPSLNEFVEITVKDTGIGIPAEQLPHVFDRFYQVDSSSTREYEGSGIGLALVKELVELHHGSISVTSTVGKGSIFTVHLPLGKDHLRPEEIIATAVKATRVEADIDFADFETAEGRGVKGEGRRAIGEERLSPLTLLSSPTATATDDETIILVVEDHADFRHFIRSHLEPAYKVIEAANGAEGWENAVTIIPDLIISDVMMPKMNGYELCAKLKTDERTSHIPVILLTAKAGADDKISGLQTGADDYLSKPFDAKELQARLRNLIELRRALRERFQQAVVLKPSELAINSADEVFLKKVLAVVEKHLGEENLTVDEVADASAMSRAQLNRKLRALTGKSVMEFVQSIRLQRAAELLQKKAGTVAEIAFMVGFGDPSYFTKSFRKQFGKTPSEFAG